MEHIQTSFILTGKDNYISLLVEGIPCDELEAKIDDGGTITKIKGCEFMIRPSRIGDIEINLFKKKKKIQTKMVYARTFPTPNTYVSYRQYSFNMIDLMGIGRIRCLMEGYDICGEYHIFSSKYKMTRCGREVWNGRLKEGKFDSLFYYQIHYLLPNDEILFYDVEIKLPGASAKSFANPLKIYFLGEEKSDPKWATTDELFQGTFPNNRFNDMKAVRKYINRENIKLYQAKYTQKNGGAVVRMDYDQFDHLLLVSEVDFEHRIDTTETFDPETYEQKLTMIDEYYDFPIGQYKLFYGDKNCPCEFRLQGRFDTNGRAGKWQACDYSKGFAEIYELDYDLPDEKEVIKKIK